MVNPRRHEHTVILVVEDDPAARQLYRAALTQGEFNVSAVEDGLEALRYLDSHEPAAVVLDLGLPRLHGRDVLKELAAHDNRIPIVVVTGTSEQFEDRQVASVLRKPISGDVLLATVRRAINIRHG
jgi:DNA-binding response OmpR family regulator